MRQGRLVAMVLVVMMLSGLTVACQATPEEVPETGLAETVTGSAAPEGSGAPAGGPPPECLDDPDLRKCAVFRPGETIKIGFAGPMTDAYSAFGIDISNAGLLAIEDYGAFGDFTFELDVQDTQGAPEGGAQVANLFSSDPRIVAIAGHTFSGSTAAAIPIYEQSRIPMLSGSATQADLTQDGNQVFNRIAFTDDVQGTNVASYLVDKLGVTRLAVMHDGSAYGQGLAEKVRDVFGELGGEVVRFEPITPGEADYTGPLNAIGALGPEALFYGGYDAEAAIIKNQMKTTGLADVVFFSDDGAYGKKFLELADENADGAYATSAVPPASPEKDAFEADYKASYGIEANSLSTFTCHGYDIVAALMSTIKATAIQGADGNLYVPRLALVQAVRGLKGFKGLTGEITCDATGECNTAGPSFFVVREGQWVAAP